VTVALAPAPSAAAVWAGLSVQLRERLPEATFFSFYASALAISIDQVDTLTVALANEFCVSHARRCSALVDQLLTTSPIARVKFVSRDAIGLPTIDERPDPIIEAVIERDDQQLRARNQRAVERQREQPPGVITRLLAERGFWSLDPASQLALFEVDDLHGALQVVPSAYGLPGTYEAAVFTGLLTLWAGGDRAEPRMETSLHQLAELLRLSWGGRTSAQLVEAIERLKATSYRVVVQQDAAGGWTDLFSLLDRVQTRWNGPASSPHRHVAAVFSEPIWEAISQPRVLRPVDLDVLHGLGKNRDLAKRLFLYIEGIPMHRLPSGDEFLERVVDERLAATLGAKPQLYDLRRHLERAGKAIAANAPRYRSIEIVPRVKRGLRSGEPTHLLRVVRSRVAASR